MMGLDALVVIEAMVRLRLHMNYSKWVVRLLAFKTIDNDIMATDVTLDLIPQ